MWYCQVCPFHYLRFKCLPFSGNAYLAYGTQRNKNAYTACEKLWIASWKSCIVSTFAKMAYAGGFQPVGHGPVVGHDAVFSGPQSFSTVNSISTINSKLRVTTFLSLSW